MSTHAAALEPVSANGERRRLELTGAALLSAAMGASGLLAYAFHIVAARTLSQADYGRVAVLWGALFIAVVALFRPLEQTVARTVADRLARGTEATTVLRAGAVVLALTVGALVVASAAAWNALSDRLFLGSDLFTAMLVLGTAGYGLQYFVRGVLGGMRWFRGLAACHVSDAAVRLALVVPLLFAAWANWAAIALAGAALGGALLPVCLGRRRFRGLKGAGGRDRAFKVRTALSFAGPAGIVAAADQLLVNGAPLLAISSGGADASRAAGLVFAATMLVRVPVFVFQGVAGSLLPNLTRLNAADDHDSLAHTVMRVAGVLAGLALVAIVGAATLGPTAMRVLYGSEYVAPAFDLALLGIGVGSYLASATFSQALFALDRGRIAAVAWAASAIVFLGYYAAAPGDELRRIAGGIALATTLDAVLLLVAFVRARR